MKYFTSLLIVLFPIFAYAQFLACQDEVILFLNDDHVIFEEEWFLEGFSDASISLTLFSNGTSIGNFEFGTTAWNDGPLFNNQQLDYTLTDHASGNNCSGTLNIFYNPTILCHVTYIANVEVNLGSSQHLEFNLFEFINFQAACVQEYEITLSNSYTTLGPVIVENLPFPNGVLYIEDGSSIANNKEDTNITISSVQNPTTEFYELSFPIQRHFPALITYDDNVTDTRTYETSSISSSSTISGPGHRSYSACSFIFSDQEIFVELIPGFEVSPGTRFTARTTSSGF